MLHHWLSERTSPALFGLLYFAAVVAGHFVDRPLFWLLVAVAICVGALLLWRADHRRMRAITDTPTSRIASAQQGRVELVGKAAALPGQPLISPFTALPCVWYRYRHERLENNKWQVVSQGRSDHSFLIDDGSGQVLVDPDGAEITTDDVRRSQRQGQRWTEWLLIPGARIYALGMFSTLAQARSEVEARDDLNAMLADWKRDRPGLLARFDVDGDGEIDMREWALARNAAMREVRASHDELRAQAPLHTLRKPADGTPFLLSTHAHDALATRHRWWAMAHFVLAAIALVLTLTALFRFPFPMRP